MLKPTLHSAVMICDTRATTANDSLPIQKWTFRIPAPVLLPPPASSSHLNESVLRRMLYGPPPLVPIPHNHFPPSPKYPSYPLTIPATMPPKQTRPSTPTTSNHLQKLQKMVENLSSTTTTMTIMTSKSPTHSLPSPSTPRPQRPFCLETSNNDGDDSSAQVNPDENFDVDVIDELTLALAMLEGASVVFRRCIRRYREVVQRSFHQEVPEVRVMTLPYREVMAQAALKTLYGYCVAPTRY